MKKIYYGETNQYTAYPLGGTGAGMICLEGTGALSHASIYHRPEVFKEPGAFAALTVKHPGGKNDAVVLEGQVAGWKIFRQPGGGNGMHGKPYGLARFRDCSFSAEFPFGTAVLEDEAYPVTAEITGWSPFIPGDTRSSCLPLAAVEYKLVNKTDRELELVFSFHCSHFLSPRGQGGGVRRVARREQGIVLQYLPTEDRACDRAWFAAECDAPGTAVDPCWFRGFSFDDMMSIWKHVENGDLIDREPYPETDARQSGGGSLYVPLKIAPRGTAEVALRFTWYVPESDLRVGSDPCCCGGGTQCGDKTETYRPWYATQYGSIDALCDDWAASYSKLRRRTRRFTDTLYASTLDDAVMDAVTANLCILKSPTVLRQHDGRLWGWEGCCDSDGCCHGTCTHVWNYAQSLCHLFPELERSLRTTEFHESQDENGHQNFRSSLPIRPADHEFHAAADGQLGGMIKVYRDYRISGDREWLTKLWPYVKKSMEYCISVWDRDRSGELKYPHHNTYDIEFWGLDGMHQSIYVLALRAMTELCGCLGEDAAEYERLFGLAKNCLETRLYNGRYFIQQVMQSELGLDFFEYTKGRYDITPESRETLEKEGPHYQYGAGCLSDGIIGDWMGFAAGLPDVADSEKVKSHLQSVFRYNFRESLLRHSNAQRASYAYSDEKGLLLCSWPEGGKPTLPFLYSDEVWTGIEYQAAAHMASKGMTREALIVVEAARSRYDGRTRNPFNEYECGHWYARAMSSYSLLQGFTGIRYDGVTGTLTVAPHIAGDFACFISTAFGYGLAGVRDGQPFLDCAEGEILVKKIEYTRCDGEK